MPNDDAMYIELHEVLGQHEVFTTNVCVIHLAQIDTGACKKAGEQNCKNSLVKKISTKNLDAC